MKKLFIEIEDELHKQIKVKTAKIEQSIKDYIVKLVEEDLKKKKKS